MMRPNPSDHGQLLAWAAGLGRTRAAQVKIIRDLITHANEDRMSVLDRRFAIAALRLLVRLQVVA